MESKKSKSKKGEIEAVKTKTKKTAKQPEVKKWYLIDAKGKVLGRLASRIAQILTGKNKVSWLPYKDSGDFVVVINAAKVAITGRKEERKFYYRYSGYPGGLRKTALKTQRVEKPETIIEHAVKGMVAKNRLGSAVLKKLYVYPGEKHPHVAQKVEELEV